MYKMIVFDIDGTLIKYKVTEQKFDEKILKMFKKLKDNGYIVVLATGRDHISIGDLHLSENIDYFIGANGSFIYDVKSQKEIWTTSLSINDFQDYKNQILDSNIGQIDNVILSDDKNIFVYSIDQIKDHWFWKNFSEKSKAFELYKSEMNIDKFHLITINCLDEKLINLSHDFFSKNETSLEVQAFWKNGFFVSEKKLNKATTIERLAKKLNFGKEQIIAFGDGENDIQMIKMAGMGIAMKNGIDKLKELANDIAEDVENYGTYYKLKDLGII